MKKFLLPLILVSFFALGFSGCKDKDEVSSKGYPGIETVQRYINGDWEVTTWIESDGSRYDDSGVVYSIRSSVTGNDYDTFEGGYLSKGEDGQFNSPVQYYLEPLLKGDIDGSDSEKIVGVYIDIFYHGEYLITDISSSSMTLREWSISNGKIVLEEGMKFTKITE